MVATNINSQRGTEALKQVRELLEEHGTDEQRQRLDRIMGGRMPSPSRAPIECSVYLAEALAVLFEMVAEIKEAQKPRPRGRPRKDTA
jgi:hypothetical protein